MTLPPGTHGYWSDSQDAHGVSINVYRREDGTEVLVTQASTEPPMWPDTIDLGPVVAWVRNVRKERRSYRPG